MGDCVNHTLGATFVSRSRRRSLPLTGLLATVLVAQMLGWVQPAVAATVDGARAAAAPGRSVPVSAVKTGPQAIPAVEPAALPAVVWPTAATADVDLPLVDALRPESGRSGRSVTVGGLPVTVEPASTAAEVPALDRSGLVVTADAIPARVKVEVLDRSVSVRAGSQLAVRVSRADGVAKAAPLRVSIDYRAFRHAFGAGWGSRLRLVSLPACSLTTPDLAECQESVALSGVANDDVAGVVSAEVAVAGPLVSGQGGGGPAAMAEPVAEVPVDDGSMIVALVAGVSSNEGTFAKTPLTQSSSWQAGLSSGAFTYDYPLSVPPVRGGLVPDISLGYNSSSVDGRTNAESAQTSVVGEGWNWEPGYIERTYRSCAQDTDSSRTYTNNTGDLCWREENATLSWGGRSGELIPAGSNTWKLSNDDLSLIEKLSLTDGRYNYTNGNQYWRITTPDGTQYYFGVNMRPGSAPGDYPESQAAWGVPVFANSSDEPCYSSSGFSSSWCTQAWRWNLDYVIDPSGNTISYYYAKEQARTGRAGSTTTTSVYDRSGVLTRIDYGGRPGSNDIGSSAAGRVDFEWGWRCLTSCGTLASPTTANWFDTPWDLDCKTTASSCPGNKSPSFWTYQRLTKVKTSYLLTSLTPTPGFVPVDEWVLGHAFPATFESSVSPALWLSSITRTGSGSSGSITLPSVTFAGNRYANRAARDVNYGNQANIYRYRVNGILLESGGLIWADYQSSDCGPTEDLPNPDQNSKRCFPALYTPPDATVADWAWWNKYRVQWVEERDFAGVGPYRRSTYEYVTAGSSSSVLWRHNDAAWGTRLADRSWSDFRGWANVTVFKGDGADGPQSKSSYRYIRGMDGDRTDAGWGTRAVTAYTTEGGTVGFSGPDSLWQAGFLIERIDYADAASGTVVNRVVNWPLSFETATRSVSDASPVNSYAHQNVTGSTATKTPIAATGTTRIRKIDYSYNGLGLLSREVDHGAVNPDLTEIAGDEVCTLLNYALTSSTVYMLDRVKDKASYKNALCNQTYQTALSVTRISYDGQPYGSLPSDPALVRGLPTKTEMVSNWPSNLTKTWTKIASNTYDIYGQVLTVSDGLDRVTETKYETTAAAMSGPTVKVTTKNPLGHETVVNLDPSRALPLTMVDPNGKTTTGQYDAVGRLLKIWQPGNPTSGTPDAEYTYTLQPGAPSWVRTKALAPNGNTIDSYEILDGFLRPRQTQTPTVDGKRVVADTVYDTRGLAVKSSVYPDPSAAPSSALANLADTSIEVQHRYTYDGTGRQVTDQLWSLNLEVSRVTNTYDGDRSTVDQPAGGTDTTALTDIFGRAIQVKQYQAGTPTGAADSTYYSYDLLGQQTGITDAAGKTWTYTYDKMGRKISTIDPDAGTSTIKYNNASEIEYTIDGRGQKIIATYDLLGRKKATYAGTETAATQLTGYEYDPAGAKGQLSSATRYVGGSVAGGAAYVSRVTAYDDGYRPLSSELVIPTVTGGTAAENALAGTYSTTATYKATGAPWTNTSMQRNGAAVGGLPAETFTHAYNAIGQATSTTSTWTGGSQTYVNDTSYVYDGQAYQRILGNAGKQVRHTFTYDPATRRLTKSQVETETQTPPGPWVDQATDEYAYDLAGNVRTIAGKTGGVRDQVECFDYDYLRRMTTAWTMSSWSCTSGPQKSGAAPYWMTWAFDLTGNRTSQTTYNTDSTEYSKTTYGYGKLDGTQPHTMTSTSTTGAGAGTASYGYDAAGNTLNRPGTGLGQQTLAWDPEGHLASVTDGGANTSFVYDANGARLIRKDPGGWATLTLPDGTELKANPAGAVAGTRYVAGVAVRSANVDAQGVPTTGDTLTWTIADHHGTGQLAIDSVTVQGQRRRSLPYGGPNGTQPGGFGTKGFVGGTNDPTGLTHLNAREYDPSIGRFISIDPVFNGGEPQSWNGYAYANNAPITSSDPTGLDWFGDAWSGVVEGWIDVNTAPVVAINDLATAQNDVAASLFDSSHSTRVEFNEYVDVTVNAAHSVIWSPVSTPVGAWEEGKAAYDAFQDGDVQGGFHHAYKSANNAASTAAMFVGGGAAAADGVSALKPTVMVRGTNRTGLLTSRGKFRVGTTRGNWQRAEDGPRGGKLCPTQGPTCSGEVFILKGTRARPRDWDNSHNPSWTNRWFWRLTSRGKVLDNYNSGTFLECVPCNRSRQNHDELF